MERTEVIRNKIMDWPALGRQIARWRLSEKKIVFTNGCFDILHLGHADYLCRASELGDCLIIGLNSDASVKKLKGEHRPVSDQNSRAFLLASMVFVDAVIIFDEDTPQSLIAAVLPDVLVKADDYQPEQIAGYHEVTAAGGKVMTVPLLPGYSTTTIESRIKSSA
jgi:D-glycero-beta-D-manno-heptose 1-phosphate adenylyltransferase